MTARRAGRAFAAAAVLALTVTAAPAPATAAPAPTTAAGGRVAERPGRAPAGTGGLAGVVDELLTRQLAERKIPGAAVTVVGGGTTLFSRGYGYADVGRGVEVDPERTLFRTGSVGKLFTWTAVMQLVEQGKLRLDADVNTYLDFQLPDTYPGRPVTLEALLTHTAGFEELNRGLFGLDGALPPLGGQLRSRMPERVRPPGEVTSYSNYGAALAGYIVQRVSGVPYEKWVDDRIFRPLGMSSTSALQPLPTALASRLATGYEYDGGNQPKPVETLTLRPAGGHAATVTDMSRFLLAQLGGGQYGGGRILSAATTALMQQPHFANMPGLAPMDYGFYEHRYNDRRLVEHGGDTLYFHSLFLLLPEEGVGLYVVYNGAGDPDVEKPLSPREELARAVVDQLAPRPAAKAAPAPAGDLQRYAGSYVSTRTNESTVERVAALQQVTVDVGEDGTLRTPAGEFGSDATRETIWEPAGPDLFRERGGQDLLGFRRGADGAVTYVFEGNAPIVAWQRAAWWQNGQVHQLLAAGGLVVLLLGTLGWMITALVLRLRRGRADRRGVRRARALGWVTAGTAVAFALLLLTLLGDFEQYVIISYSPLVSVTQAAGGVLALLTLAMVVAAVVVWVRRIWRPAGRAGYTVLTLAAVSLSVVAAYYNLASVQFS